MKKVLTFPMIIVTGLNMMAYSSPPTSSGSSSNQGGEILVGCLQDVAGPTSSLGQITQAGVQWTVNKISEGGGIDGKKIKINNYDTRGDVTEAVNAFIKAVTVDKVNVTVDPPVANIALAIKEISEQCSVPIMSSAMDKNAQLKQDGTPYKNMFTFQPNAGQQGAIVAKYAIENGPESFDTIYSGDSSYSTSLLAPFVQTVESSDDTIPKNLRVVYSADDTDFKTLLSPIVKASMGTVFVPDYAKDLVNIITAAHALGYRGALIYDLNACLPFNIIMDTGCDGVYYTNNIDDAIQALQDMVKVVKERTGVEATNKFFLGYDIVNIIAEVLKENSTSDPAGIRTALESVTDYSGMTGNISIDPRTHMIKSMEMFMFTYERTTPKFLQKFTAWLPNRLFIRMGIPSL